MRATLPFRKASTSDSAQGRGGFTLMEILIVIAVVGVLVAIAIPVLGSQMERARLAADQSNVRSGKAAAVAQYAMTGMDTEKKYYYNANTGSVQESSAGIVGYGQSSVNDTTGEKTGAVGTPNNGQPNYVCYIVSPDGQVVATWGDGYGSTWRNLVPSLPLSAETDYHNYAKNKEAYDNIRIVDDDKRVSSDIDALKSMANYFEGMSEADLREAFGSYYNSFVNGNGSTLFRYQIDNGSYSVHFDNVKGGTGYFEDLGYTPVDIVSGATFTDKSKQYGASYLFTSEEVIQTLGKRNDIQLKLNVSDGKVTSARVWINGSTALDSNA